MSRRGLIVIVAAFALAGLVLSDAPTVRWKLVSSVAVDGGTTALTSPEGAAAIRDLADTDPDAWDRMSEQMFDSLLAHDWVTMWSLAGRSGRPNLAYYTSGDGDGLYPVYAGYDATGRATRVVVDFLVLHLDWSKR